jgi:hypothetical protein
LFGANLAGTLAANLPENFVENLPGTLAANQPENFVENLPGTLAANFADYEDPVCPWVLDPDLAVAAQLGSDELGSNLDPEGAFGPVEPSASEKLAPEKLALEKLAPERLALEKLASERLALEKLAPEKLAPEKPEA